jgi:hypothetical protein
MNNGKTPKIISVEKYVKKLTKPSINTLRIPNWEAGLSFEANSVLYNFCLYLHNY